jgi:hypothetical protein
LGVEDVKKTDDESEAADRGQEPASRHRFEPTAPAFPPWAQKAGLICGVATLIFLMSLVVAAVSGRSVPQNSAFLVVAVLSLGVALASAFIGGDAAAKGRVPIPGVQRHAIEFSAAGGIAVFVLVMVLSSWLYPRRDGDMSEAGVKIAILPSQLEEVRRVAEIFSGKSESDLQNDLGLDELIKRNVDLLFASYRHSAFNEKLEIQSVIRVGDTMKVLAGGRGTVNLESGKFTQEKSDRAVKYLILPQAFLEAVARLRKFHDSPFLTEATRKLLMEYISLTNENANLLGDILEEAARELPTRYPKPTDEMSWIWINNRFVQKIQQLEPKARAIKNNLREYVAIEPSMK